MLPPKPDAQVAPLPQLRHSASATEVRQPRGSGHSGFGLDADGPTLWTQTMPAPGNGGAAAAGQQPFQGRPSSGVSQRPPRFNNLMPAGNLRDSWSPPGAERAAAALSDPIARSLSGERSWNALELGQLDPNCLPPWLAQVLERLQFMEARAMGQQPQGNRVRTYPYRPGRDGAAGVAGADESDAVCALQDTVQDLQRQLQAQRADSDALQRRLQQLEAKAGDGGDGGGGGEYAAAGTAGAEWEARLVRCEARLDDHDVNLARLRASSSQPLESRVTDVEHQLKTFSVSLLATATSAASAAESAGQALSRVEGLERRLAEGAVTGSGSGVSPEVVAAATRSAPSQQQLLSMGLEPRVAEQVGRLPGLGLDANVWAELLKRLANAQEDTRQVDERLKRLISNPAQVAAASRPSSSGMPSPAVQQMLAAGMEPRVVEQLSKLEALGVDPSPFAVVMSRQAATEEGLKAFATNPAAAAAAAQKVLSAGSPSPAQQQLLAAGTDPMVTEQLAKLEALGVDPLLIADLLKKQASMEKELAKLAKNPVLAAVAAAKKGGKPPMAKEQQMVVAGVQPKVAEQLAKLEAFGLDPLLFADLVKRQRDTEQALGRLIKNPAATAAAAAAEERAANGGTPATADQDAVKAGLDAKAVDELRKLEALGVDPAVFADVMQRLGRTEQALEGLLHSPAGSAAASKQASGAGSSVAEQQMLAAGIEPQLAAELAKLGAIGVDPLPLAGVIQKQWDTEQAVGRLLKNPAAAVVAAAAAERGAGAAGPSPAQKQLLDTGVEPAVVEELGKLEALGVSPGVLGSLIRRVGDSERAVDQLMQGPAGAATAAVAAKKAAGGALTPVEQAMVAEGLDSKVAEQLAKLEVVGMDPLLFADLVKRVNVAIEAAQRVGAEAAQRTEALTAFAEALAAKHDALVSEVKGIRDVVAAAGDGTSKLGDLTQLAITIAELGGRCTAMERDLAMALTSYARIVDLKVRGRLTLHWFGCLESWMRDASRCVVQEDAVRSV